MPRLCLTWTEAERMFFSSHLKPFSSLFACVTSIKNCSYGSLFSSPTITGFTAQLLTAVQPIMSSDQISFLFSYLTTENNSSGNKGVGARKGQDTGCVMLCGCRYKNHLMTADEDYVEPDIIEAMETALRANRERDYSQHSTFCIE